MRVVQLLNVKRVILCLGLIGMFPVAGGCGPDYNTAPIATEEQKDRMNKFTEDMKASRGQMLDKGKKTAEKKR
jgi:hypothetical protein